MSSFPAEAAPREPLAVIGLSCLFPKAANVAEFWSNIRRGVDAITEVPATHWNPDDYFDADPKSPDMTYARRGGFLSPVAFDPLEFGIAPSNLEAIDTSQLLGLVGAKRALEDAGYGADRQFDRSRIGCILGVTGTLEMVIPLGARLGHPKWRTALKDAGVADDVAEDVIQRISESYVPWQENSFPGLLGNVVAGRIANRLDLGGTNCVVDAACASSLSAMHLAALELWSGRAEMMITGGIDTFNDIFMYMCFSKTPALSPSGNAKPFSDDGDGTILGEGVGMFVLKRLSDAERDGDRVHAVIRGIGTSSDGAGNAVYAPKKEGQVRCLQNAYELAGVSPATVELIEAHGTGTKVGDATELAGLTEVFQTADKSGRWCAVGSVKSQIGHTKAAAGAAGVMKAILALKHRVLPPTIKVDRPLPALCDDANPLYANTQARPWLPSSDHPRRAGVSAFGFGGSNFHCVLEESATTPDVDWDDDVLFAAWSADSLVELAQQLDDWRNLSDRRDIRRRAAESRRQFQSTREHRLVLVADGATCELSRLIATAQSNLQKYAERASWSTPDGISYARGPRPGKLGLLFPGQGSQYVGMQRELACRFPALQGVLAEANDVFSTYAPERLPSRLSDYVYPLPAFDDESRDRQESALRDTEVAQPALGAVSLGLLAVLAEFGARPEVVAGHSYGELTALCASRRFAPEALYRLSMLRGRLMAEAQEVEGGMLAVGAPLSQVEAALKEAAIDLVIANRNSPSQVVLSGRISELDRAHETLTRRNIRGKRLPVAAAFHSPLVASAGERFRAVLEEIEFAAAELPVFANTHAEEYPDDADAARSLLAGQLAQPVEFVRQIENMYDSGVRLFLEVGPGGVLTGLVGSILSDREHRACAVDSSSGKRSGMLDLALALGQLGVAGYAVDLAAWDPISESDGVATTNGSARLTIPLCGANYVKPRTPKPPTRREPLVHEAVPAAPVSPEARPSAAVVAVREEKIEERKSSSLPPSAVALPPSAPQPSTLNSQPALPALSVLMKMHEQTAQLHRQFLDGQEAALRTLESLARGENGLRIEDRGSKTENRQSSSLPPSALGLPPAASQPSTLDPRLSAAVLEVVAEKTGYPAEMLKPEMSLDHDLGIDSIKRVEILSALQERRPDLPAVKPEQLGTLHRLQDVIELLSQASVEDRGSKTENRQSSSLPPSALGLPPSASRPSTLDPQLSTSVPQMVPAPAAGRRLPFTPGSTFLIVSDGTPAARQVGRRLEQLGYRTQSARWDDRVSPANSPALAGLLLMAPEQGLTDGQLWNALDWVKQCGPALRDAGKRQAALVATLSRLDGCFGLSMTEQAATPLSGALAGLAKTVRHEWPEVSAKAIDLSAGVSADDRSVAELVERLLSDGPVEIGLAADGWRSVETIDRPWPAAGPPPVAPGDLVVITGGARGVTAACAIELAKAWKPRLLLLGRTPLTEEPQGLSGLASAAEIKSALLRQALPGTTPRDIERQSRQILATRDIHATLQAIRAVGAEAEYVACDIRNAADVAKSLHDVQRRHGPVRGVIHGAGVLEDRRIEDKTREQFENVFQTKVTGWRNVLAALDPEELRCAALFASSTGRFGRTGQVDYAMANEALNKLAQEFQAKHPDCRIRSFNWGPWDGGMVTDALKPLFAQEGIGLIPVEAGAQLLVRELEQARPDRSVEVVVLAGLEPDDRRSKIEEGKTSSLPPSAVGLPPAAFQLSAAVLEVVSEKTGYPAEMLKPEMSLDHDLGIDSIKRVEILSALQERRPDLPAVKPEQLGTLHRLQDVIELLIQASVEDRGSKTENRQSSSLPPSALALPPAASQLSVAVLEVVSEKTGYPAEMLKPEMSLDHDLGIDSIKRVEILSALQERRPDLPAVKPEQLGTLHRLQDVIDLLSQINEEGGSKTEDRKAFSLPPSAVALPPAAVALPPSNARLGWERVVSLTTHSYLESHVIGGKAVLPTAMILECLAHAALHGNPGLEFVRVEKLRIFKGVRLGCADRPSLRVMTEKARREQQEFLVPAALVQTESGREIQHARADIVLSAARPAAPVSRLTPKINQNLVSPPADWYGTQLFHGSRLQGLTAIEALSPHGIIVRSSSAAAPETWSAEPWRRDWLADPLAIDVALQAVIVWTQSILGLASLPTAIGSYRQFRRNYPAEGVRIAITAERRQEAMVVANAEVLAADGSVIATLSEIEHVLDAQLHEAFQRNRIE